MRRLRTSPTLAPIAAALCLALGCASQPAVEPPRETLEVNMFGPIDDQVRAKVEQDLEALFESEKEIF